MTNKTPMSKRKFEINIHKLTSNPRVISALLICFDTKNFTIRKELGLFSTDHKEFNGLVSWIINSRWLE